MLVKIDGVEVTPKTSEVPSAGKPKRRLSGMVEEVFSIVEKKPRVRHRKKGFTFSIF